MRVRKSLFLALVISALVGGLGLAREGRRPAAGETRLTADGCDPMPIPRPIRGRAALSGPSVRLLSDGSDPMPRPPQPMA